MTDHSDGELLRAAGRGEARAFEALVGRHQSALLRHARSLLGESGGHEDVVQDAFLRLVQKPPTLPPSVSGDADAEGAHLRSWLHRVTRNCCMDVLRSETRRKTREEAVSAPADAPARWSGGLESVEARDTRAAVETSLAKLPPDQNEVLVLRLLGGRSYREIAEITGKKVGTVGWLVSEGLKALSRELAPRLAVEPDAPSEPRATGLRGELS